MEEQYVNIETIHDMLYSKTDCVRNVLYNHVGIQIDKEDQKNLKASLYILIIRQLLADGYALIAALLNRFRSKDSNANMSIEPSSQTPSNKLQLMHDIMAYIDKRSQIDENFLTFLSWCLTNNAEPDFDNSSNNSLLHSSESNNSLNNIANNGNNNQQFCFNEFQYDAQNNELDQAYIGPASQLQVAFKFGSIGRERGQLDKPHGFCIGIDDDIVIADTNNHRICIFDINGQFKSSFGIYGTEEGQLFQPRKIAMLPPQGGKPQVELPVFVVCDRGPNRSRMQIFTLTGEFVRLIDIPYMDIVAGLTTTLDNLIVIVDSVRSSIVTMNANGDILRWISCALYMKEPSDIVLNNDHYFICDFKGHCVAVIDREGHLVKKLSARMLKFPNGIEISDDGKILCGDSHGNRFHISVFSSNGELIQDYECPCIKVSRCCGLKLTSKGLIVTLAKNNHHAVVLKPIFLKNSNG